VFGADSNTVTLLDAAGGTTVLGELPKDDVADAIWDAIVMRLDPLVDQGGTA
jgi:phosphopantothenoylcysteine decarboxylase/phosphopantothenate--cysteine ligase